jgi:hypothetical protein
LVLLDSAAPAHFNRLVAREQHRWRNSLDDERSLEILDDLSADLRWSWERDSKRRDSKMPKRFPINTVHLLGEACAHLFNKGKAQKRTGKIVMPPPRPLNGFGDLFDENTLRIVYENQHADSYVTALKLAGTSGKGSSKAFHKLLKAAECAYHVDRGGMDTLPAPRIHFLHRELLDIAARLKLDELTNTGLEEFFEDICPCGKKHRAEAIRKLRKGKESAKPNARHRE